MEKNDWELLNPKMLAWQLVSQHPKGPSVQSLRLPYDLGMLSGTLLASVDAVGAR